MAGNRTIRSVRVVAMVTASMTPTSASLMFMKLACAADLTRGDAASVSKQKIVL